MYNHLNTSEYMKTKFLLPNTFKSIGWVLLGISTVSWIYVSLTGNEFLFLRFNVLSLFDNDPFGKMRLFNFINVNTTNTIIGSLFIIGGLLVSFSKEKIEDEFIKELRLSSFQWAFLVNYLILLLLFLVVYDFAFLTVMIYNMFTVLILFIIRFNYLLIRNRTATHEK